MHHWERETSDFGARRGVVGPQTAQNIPRRRSARGGLFRATRRADLRLQREFSFRPRRADHAAGLFGCSTSANSWSGRRLAVRWQTSMRSTAGSMEIIVARKFEIVAVSNSNLIGFGGLYVHGDLLDHCGSLILGVREKDQGRGVGSTLLGMLLTAARSARKSSPGSAHSLCGKCGRHSPLSQIWLRIRGFAPVLFTARN